MKQYFPRPYGDEYLYSIITRYLKHTNSTEDLIVRRRIFLTLPPSEKNQTIRLLNKIGNFLNQLWLVNAPTAGSILSRSYNLELLLALSTNNVLSYKSKETISFLKGLNNKYLIQGVYSNFLKFCPQCNERHLVRHGEGYWMSMHQFRNITYCYKHKTKLIQTCIPNTPRRWFSLRTPSIFKFPEGIKNYQTAHYDDLNIPKNIQMRMLQFINGMKQFKQRSLLTPATIIPNGSCTCCTFPYHDFKELTGDAYMKFFRFQMYKEIPDYDYKFYFTPIFYVIATNACLNISVEEYFNTRVKEHRKFNFLDDEHL